MPPKPILKKTAMPANGSYAGRAVNPRHLDLALYHANIIQERKLVEQQILDAVLELMEFPTTPDADPTKPSPSDALRFREAIIPFQPADYDSLIEERNIADKCGYALCPRSKRKAPTNARKHFIETARGVEIVDRKVLEVWCSDDCAKRALYVKVQLNEEPAWLRQGGRGDKIELMVDNADEHDKALPVRLKQKGASPPPTNEDEDLAAAWAARDDALADLAIERGEKQGRLSKATKELLQERIRERVASTPPVPPTLPDQTEGRSHMAIEGHVPKATGGTKDEDDENGDDDDTTGDRDWDKHLPG